MIRTLLLREDEVQAQGGDNTNNSPGENRIMTSFFYHRQRGKLLLKTSDNHVLAAIRVISDLRQRTVRRCQKMYWSFLYNRLVKKNNSMIYTINSSSQTLTDTSRHGGLSGNPRMPLYSSTTSLVYSLELNW